MVKAVIFDMDGLMFDTERIWGSCWEPALARHGLKYREGLADAMRATAGQVAVEHFRSVYPEAEDPQPIIDTYASIAHERFAHGVEKKLGLDELLAFLDERGIPRTIASSSDLPLIERNLKNAGIERYFDTSLLVSGHNVRRSKPEPDVFLAAAERMGSDPTTTLVLEDSFVGVEAGHAGGFVTVMVPDIAQPTPKIAALATRVCASLLEVRDLLAAGEL